MFNPVRGMTLVTFGLAIIVAFAGCSSGSAPIASQPSSGQLKSPSNGLVQSSSVGSVDIDVKWLGAMNNTLAFDVALNTHSADLDQIDLGEQAVLRDDAGKEYRPVSWNSAPGGHHRSGSLALPIPDLLAQGEARYIEMIIRNVAGVQELILRWQL